MGDPVNYYSHRRCEEISIVKMFNPNLKENKSYNMDFKHKNDLFALLTHIISLKFSSVT